MSTRSRVSIRLLALGVTLASALPPVAARAQSVRTDFAMTNGTVNSQVLVGGTLYLGGSFSSVGPATGSGVPVDTVSGQVLANFPVVIGNVKAVAPDSLGGWYIGGTFSSVGGQTRHNLAHILADLSVDSWAPEPDQQVLTLIVNGAVVIAGGDFTSIGGQSRHRIAALDVTTGLATAWDPNANATVRALALTDSVVYVGGDFTSIGGQSRARIAAVDPATGLASPWNPGSNGSVFALDAVAGAVYAGGFFSVVAGQLRIDLAAIDAASAQVTAWNPHPDNQVFALAAGGGRLYVGGAFSTVGGQPRSRIAAIDLATALAVSGWDPSANGNVLALTASGDAIYVGGDFVTIGGQSRTRAAALDPATGLATTWNPRAYGTVNALAPGGAAMFVGGSFAGIGGSVRNNIAAIDVASGAVTAWDPNADGQVFALARGAAQALLVGGQFGNIGGAARNNIAALDLTGGAATAWNPNASGMVSALASAGAVVYAGGLFTTIGGQSRADLAALDAASGLATSWNPNVNGQIFALTADARTVTIGGSFTSAGGQSRNMIASLDATTGLAASWNPNSNGTVRALVPGCGVVYVGGFFTTIGGSGRNRIAVLDATTGAATAWNANANGPVFALTTDNGALYAGGLFSTIGGQSRNRIAALDPTTSNATSWNPGADNVVRTFAVGGGALYAGGSFAVLGGLGAACVASISEDGSLSCPAIALSPALLPDGRVGTAYAQSVTASGGTTPYCYSVTAGALPAGFALDPASGQLAGTPTTAGSFTFTVTATTANGCVGTRDYALQLRPACPILTVLPATLPLGHVDAAYTETLSTTAGTAPLVWSVTSGMLPAGLSLSPAGLISGTPSTVGAASFSISVTDANLCAAVASFTLSIFPPCGAVAIAPAQLPDGAVGVNYDQTLHASGGRPPYAWSVASGTLPEGVALDSVLGRLHGTPSSAGTSSVVLAASDSTGCAGTGGYTLNMFSAPPTSTIAANTSGLLITNGQPCVHVPMVYTRTDTASARGVSVTLQIDTSRLALCTPATPAASFHLGSWFDGYSNTSLLVTDNGGGSYTVDAVLLGSPCGITMGGTLFTMDLAASGPDGSGAITMTVARVRDCSNAPLPVSPGAPATLGINTQPLAIRPASIPDGSVATSYGVTFTTDSGTAPITWSVVSGTLPAGLSLDGSSGLLSGMPSAAGTSYFRVAATDVNGRSGSRSFGLTFFASPPQSQMVASAGQCITRTRPQVAAQFQYVRADSTPVRAVSIMFQLDTSRLALATPGVPSASIHAGTWLTGYGNTSLLVTDNGGGSYTVDIALLGSPCGITSGGQLLTVDLAASSGAGTGMVKVMAVHARDCSNIPVPVAGGAAAIVTIDLSGPSPLTSLVAAQVTSGNVPGDTTGIRLTWGSTDSGAQIDLYRAAFGTYPLYTDAGTPPDSALVPGAPWVHVATNPSSGYLDHPQVRGVWDYALVLTDSCGATAISNRTPGTLNYVLGDVSDGVTAGNGNNRVLGEDISLLGAHYGITGASQVNPVGYLDVGPTADGSANSRPLPDHQIDFEDLVIFASNYGVSSGPAVAAKATRPAGTAAGARERFELRAPSLVEAGTEVEAVLWLAGGGGLQGFSARLGWDATVVEPQGIEPLDYVAGQGGLVLSPGPGIIDAALLGVRSSGMSGEGEVARVRFRVLRTGVSGIWLAGVDGRDAANHRVSGLSASTAVEVPGATVLLSPAPNPTHGTATVSYTLARTGVVELGIYGVDGRRVRRLIAGEQKAGVYRLEWDGRDADGHVLAPGVFYLHMSVAGKRQTRALVLVR